MTDMLEGWRKSERARAVVAAVYTTLALHVPEPECSRYCDAHTPLCSYSEAEYLLAHLPAERYPAVIQACREWILRDDGPPVLTQAEVRRVRNTTCPFFNTHTGGCLFDGGAKPLECWLRSMPGDAREPIEQALTAMIRTYPQKTGFVPAQLLALSDQQGYRIAVSSGMVNGAKAAQGGAAPILSQ